jgi:hypothetical protein
VGVAISFHIRIDNNQVGIKRFPPFSCFFRK